MTSDDKPTALIAEDEPLMRERLKEKLAEVWPELAVAAEAGDGDEALALFDAHRPQTAFLDLRMPGRTGVEVAGAVERSSSCRTWAPGRSPPGCCSAAACA